MQLHDKLYEASMPKELSEDTSFNISLKTLITLCVSIATIVGFYYVMMGEIEEAKNLPEAGTGPYFVNPADASAKETWQPSRNEYKMKDEMARLTIMDLEEEIEDLEERLDKLEEKVYNR